MKKPLLLIALLPTMCLAQYFSEDSMFIETGKGKFDSEITLSSRNIWRGASYGDAPSVKAMMNYKKKQFEIGSYAVTTLNGNKFGYGTWIENHAFYSIGKFSFGIDDYFFFNPIDSTNNYFDYSKNRTQHFLEAQVKYSYNAFDFFAGYVIYSNKLDTTKAVYVEESYKINKNFSIFAGEVTGPSNISFTNKGGINSIGFTVTREIQVTKDFKTTIKTSLSANPNYKNVQKYPGLGTNPIYFVVSLIF